MNAKSSFSDLSLNWKFESEKSQLLSLCGFNNQNLETFYGVLPRNYTLNGNQLDVGLVVDVMTNTALRGQGLFVRSGLEAIKRLEKTNVKTVIGFPIRKEVLPGHLKVGWNVQLTMPIYLCPVGCAENTRFKRRLISAFARISRSVSAPLRMSKSQIIEIAVSELLENQNLLNFFSARTEQNLIQIDKSKEFLFWRLNRPGVDYKVFLCSYKSLKAVAIVRKMDLNGFQTIAFLDFCSEGAKWTRAMIRHLMDYAKDQKVDFLAISTNPTNAKRLKILQTGFVRSHKKFKVITRSIGHDLNPFTQSDESSFRMTWLDSDTV